MSRLNRGEGTVRMKNAAKVDAEELLHLALKASQERRLENAIEYLKRAIEISPNFGKAYYLLGAFHAELGMYDRAIEEMTRAVELEPTIDAAHFQLGLLYLTSGQIDNAINAWKSLDALGENHPFWLFKEGMINLANDEFDACIDKLGKGIKINTINEALNNDMRKVMSRAQEALDAMPEKPEAQDAKPATTQSRKKTTKRTAKGNQILLSAYKSNDDDES